MCAREREWNFYHFAAIAHTKTCTHIELVVLTQVCVRIFAYANTTDAIVMMMDWVAFGTLFLTLSLSQSLCSMNECELVEVNMQMNKVDGTGLSIKMRHIYATDRPIRIGFIPPRAC